ncbi:MAG: hypothetical protein CO114_05970, partial [Euryarchaeota archaeon CG_4_9_14_3_um_filter_38_12]
VPVFRAPLKMIQALTNTMVSFRKIASAKCSIHTIPTPASSKPMIALLARQHCWQVRHVLRKIKKY